MSESIDEPSYKYPFFSTANHTEQSMNEPVGPLKQPNNTRWWMGALHQNKWALFGLRISQFISTLVTLILASLSINFFYKSDERMSLILFFSCVSILYHSIVYKTYGIIKISNSNSILLLILMEFLQFTLWIIGVLLIVIRYPFYNCGRQGGFNRVDGCRCGQASLCFIIINMLLNLVALGVLLLNIKGRETSRLKAKTHLLDFKEVNQADEECVIGD